MSKSTAKKAPRKQTGGFGDQSEMAKATPKVTPKVTPKTAKPAEPSTWVEEVEAEQATKEKKPTPEASMPAPAPAYVSDGFDDADIDSLRLIRGTIMKCVDGEWSDRDGVQYPLGTPFLAMGVTEAVQRWQERQLIEEHIKQPGVPLPNVDELNETVPADEWEEGLNGPRPPYSHVYVVYLLDMKGGGIFTYLNSTWGCRLAITAMRDRVRWMRRLRGAQVYAIVGLGKKPMKTQKGIKQRPDLPVLEWRDFSSGTPKQIEHAKQQIGKPVAEPTTKEKLDDEISF
jgi:hypothetical protein